MCALGGGLMDGSSRSFLHAHLVCHCLLLELDRGLALVDTGFGLGDVLQPRPRLSGFFLSQLRPRLDPRETALRQVEALGFRARDVRHILVTHLDFDHAGGIEDFPDAEIHLLARELDAARARHGFIARRRYRPMQWDAALNWSLYEPGRGEPWFGFEAVRSLHGLPPEILLVPLVGHTEGHTGIAVQAEGHWLLHAGDAYFYRGEIDPRNPTSTPGLRAYQTMMQVDREARLANQQRLRALVAGHAREVRVFSAHDAVELEVFAAANPPLPDQRTFSPMGQDTPVPPSPQ